MATSPATIEHIFDTLADLPGLRAAKMFGEYALYLDGKVVALICDDTLFAKPTATARGLIPNAALAPPYPGAKPHMILTDLLDEPDLCTAILRAIATDLPEPRPKKPKLPRP